MITSKGLFNAVLYGLYTGIFLTFFFKIAQQVTSLKVYTLLLNVDYIPILNSYAFPEFIEIIFHIIISIALSVCLYMFLIKIIVRTQKQIIVLSIVICSLIGVALYPTTALSTRTPDITSISSFAIWLFGHAIYGYLLGFLLIKPLVKKTL